MLCASRALSSDRCEKGESPSRLVHVGIDDGRQVPETRCSSEKEWANARVRVLSHSPVWEGGWSMIGPCAGGAYEGACSQIVPVMWRNGRASGDRAHIRKLGRRFMNIERYRSKLEAYPKTWLGATARRGRLRFRMHTDIMTWI